MASPATGRISRSRGCDVDRAARRRIWILGLAGLGRNVGWGMNKVFTAALLTARGASSPLAGAVLGIEGLFGLILNPLTGYISDRLVTRAGRRRPFLFIAFPGAAISLLLLYFAQTLPLAIAATVLFYFFQQLSPTPYQAMMPDVCEAGDYGEASGILNLLWSVGNIIAFLVVPIVWETMGHLAAFLLGAVVLLGTGLITAVRIKEQPHEAPRARPRPDLRPLLGREMLKYYIAQALWWLGFEAIASFFTLYTVHALHGTLFDSAIGMTIFTATTVLVSIWFGRQYVQRDARLLLGGAIGLFALIAISGLLVHSVLQAFVLLAVAGVAWGGIQVVSYPLAVDVLREGMAQTRPRDEAISATAELHGAVYGLVNLVQSLGLLIAAPLAGEAIYFSGDHYQTMFVVSAASLAVSLVLVATMRRVPLSSTILSPPTSSY